MTWRPEVISENKQHWFREQQLHQQQHLNQHPQQQTQQHQRQKQHKQQHQQKQQRYQNVKNSDFIKRLLQLQQREKQHHQPYEDYQYYPSQTQKKESQLTGTQTWTSEGKFCKVFSTPGAGSDLVKSLITKTP